MPKTLWEQIMDASKRRRERNIKRSKRRQHLLGLFEKMRKNQPVIAG